MNDTFTWIITGASRGFGRAIAERALEQGDAVMAAVRNPQTMTDLAERYPETLAPWPFDARDSELARPLVRAAADRFGRVDALVNNAGRGLVGAAEEIGEAELREAMDLHFFVPAALVRAVLPVMRAQGGGTIVQMSSQGGRMSFPGVGGYSAGKFALEGWSEALAGEVAPFGVRVMIVEPSRFRTGFHGPDALAVADAGPVYRGVLAAVRADMTGADGLQEGDPVRAAGVIVDLVHRDEAPPLRLPLGAEAVERISASYTANLDAVRRWADTARAADFPDAPPSSRPIAPLAGPA
ncbi:SDR family NAD(P)-dependent oxidoreductase [Jiangella aurantiaca]|uniref:SDR family NAD(P)-dependent oxidoreductase n=1 Tax=Jiangella aurantiaca TaxID=2530373 RepID=A0A4R5A453_9ACTN|nr:SDR family NAD(P)-dependent oxidoreductase [Jiangella aurantiaca]TDD65454.1 SDR family NAD(P)-dependent oxidoreductase [Jiangella aurantiaca]